MTQAIEVKYLGETTHHGERFKATAKGGSITLPFNYQLNQRHNELAAAIALVEKMEWSDRLRVSLEHSGVLRNQSRVFTLYYKKPSPLSVYAAPPDIRKQETVERYSECDYCGMEIPGEYRGVREEHPDYLKPLVDCDALDWGKKGE